MTEQALLNNYWEDVLYYRTGCINNMILNLHKNLTCFHLTNFFGEEKFSWLPSKIWYYKDFRFCAGLYIFCIFGLLVPSLMIRKLGLYYLAWTCSNLVCFCSETEMLFSIRYLILSFVFKSIGQWRVCPTFGDIKTVRHPVSSQLARGDQPTAFPKHQTK